ncbi:hypothetical protein Y1Q_0016870 [Alligator mississippiensis]|uniref:Uncharacterized protein n=1 Tax=Alligator mississippiensis TaxID=8496 RepID=A0A151P6X5_ALLMI|nr:hypothetical protein Y1Q_0016870 [Alligator mississippiensis]
MKHIHLLSCSWKITTVCTGYKQRSCSGNSQGLKSENSICYTERTLQRTGKERQTFLLFQFPTVSQFRMN